VKKTPAYCPVLKWPMAANEDADQGSGFRNFSGEGWQEAHWNFSREDFRAAAAAAEYIGRDWKKAYHKLANAKDESKYADNL